MKVKIAVDKGDRFYANGYASNGYASNGYASNGYASNGYASNGKFMIEREFSKRFSFGKQIDTLLDSVPRFRVEDGKTTIGGEAKVPYFSAIVNSVKEEELIPLRFSGFTYQDKTDIYIHAKGIVMFDPKWRGLLLSTGILQIQDKATITYPMAIVKDKDNKTVAYVMPCSKEGIDSIVDGCKEIANSVMTESEVTQ